MDKQTPPENESLDEVDEAKSETDLKLERVNQLAEETILDMIRAQRNWDLTRKE